MHGSAHAKRLPEGLVQVALSETWRTSEQSCYAWMTARFGNRPRTATGNYRYCRIAPRFPLAGRPSQLSSVPRNRPLTTGGYLSLSQTRILRGMSTEPSSFELTIPAEPADIRNITACEESIA